jgi:hypothetical protein
MSINNYIPISRKLFEHQFWGEERVYSRFEAWLDILQSTRFEDTELLIGNRFIKIKRGQLPVSLRFLAERWKWSTKKVDNFLDVLILAQMIKKETPKETGQTVLTLCNYDKYNFDFEDWKHQKKQEGNSRETGGKQEGNKINKDNKENNENNNSPHTPHSGGEGADKSFLSETNTAPEKEKSCAKKEKAQPLRFDFVAEPFREAFMRFIDYRKSVRKPFRTQQGVEAAYRKLLEYSNKNPARAAQIVEQSIANEWQGLFELKTSSQHRRSGQSLPPASEAEKNKLLAKIGG